MSRNFERAVTAIRTYAIVPSGAGVQRWYVYRRSAAKDGAVPPDALVFFSKDRAEETRDRLNTQAVIDTWRC